MKGFKGDERVGQIGGASFVSRLRGVSVKRHRFGMGAEDRYDQPISESDTQQVAARENWVDMANFIMQLHGDLVSHLEECTKCFEVVRNTKTEVGFDACNKYTYRAHVFLMRSLSVFLSQSLVTVCFPGSLSSGH